MNGGLWLLVVVALLGVIVYAGSIGYLRAYRRRLGRQAWANAHASADAWERGYMALLAASECSGCGAKHDGVRQWWTETLCMACGDRQCADKAAVAGACHCGEHEEATCRRMPECRPTYCKLSQGVIDV